MVQHFDENGTWHHKRNTYTHNIRYEDLDILDHIQATT